MQVREKCLQYGCGDPEVAPVMIAALRIRELAFRAHRDWVSGHRALSLAGSANVIRLA